MTETLPIYQVLCPRASCGSHPGEPCWDEPTRSFLTASESHEERKQRAEAAEKDR